MSRVTIETIEARLILFLQLAEHPILERFNGLGLPGGPVLGDGHAARVVDQHSDDVLLRLELSNRYRRLPEQDQQQSGEERLQQPENARSPAPHPWGGPGQSQTNPQSQTRGSPEDQEKQNPL